MLSGLLMGFTWGKGERGCSWAGCLLGYGGEKKNRKEKKRG
jgi:hypothetical protein